MKRDRTEDDPKLVLYSYWRSSCSWRVRIALELKGLPYEYRAVNLLKGESEHAEYLAVNPSGLLPTLLDGSVKISESLAILEYLEEKFPGRNGSSLLPRRFEDRAIVRRIALHIVAAIQPLQNLGILERVEALAGKQARAQWGTSVIEEGLSRLEEMLKDTAGQYCVGDSITFADLCLVPQAYNAARFGVSMEGYPTAFAVLKRLESLDAFKAAHPDAMPDAVKA
mmetsp:Transcript_5836/g.6295  ORF Transcript_5836/g.6295 Transcript_5836/m.6295 type:complete len:225 (+) Transcript_5836:72-746(+)